MLTIRMHPPSSAHHYLSLLAQSLEAEGLTVDDGCRQPDVVHYHWLAAPFDAPTRWEALKGAGRYLVDLYRWRRRGVAVVWTVHNLDAHEGRWPGESWYMRRATRLLDGWLTLSSYAEQQALARWPRLASLDHRVVSLGDLSVALPAATHQRHDTRRSLDMQDAAALVAFVGSVRPYKGVADLIDATRALRPDEVHLLIAGEVRDPAVVVRAGEAGVTLVDRHLSEAEFVAFVEAADLVVLPFRQITHSASLLTVAALGTPVLAPRIGALPEVASSLSSIVQLYDPPLDAATVRRALRWAQDARSVPKPGLPGHDWSSIASTTADLYERAIARSSGRRTRWR
jgi:glycosyltransferase involved in cell wall biosynthesis